MDVSESRQLPRSSLNPAYTIVAATHPSVLQSENNFVMSPMIRGSRTSIIIHSSGYNGIQLCIYSSNIQHPTLRPSMHASSCGSPGMYGFSKQRIMHSDKCLFDTRCVRQDTIHVCIV